MSGRGRGRGGYGGGPGGGGGGGFGPPGGRGGVGGRGPYGGGGGVGRGGFGGELIIESKGARLFFSRFACPPLPLFFVVTERRATDFTYLDASCTLFRSAVLKFNFTYNIA